MGRWAELRSTVAAHDTGQMLQHRADIPGGVSAEIDHGMPLTRRDGARHPHRVVSVADDLVHPCELQWPVAAIHDPGDAAAQGEQFLDQHPAREITAADDENVLHAAGPTGWPILSCNETGRAA
jgi:hypothetical protein